MSNSFFHKDLTDAQWSRIKFVFEKREKVGRPSLNPCRVFNALMWILKKEQAIGSSRGGKNTKVHVLINDRMQLLKVILTDGQVHDSEPALALLSGVELGGKKILADRA